MSSEKKNFKIGEVAKMFGVNTSLLRFWETEFEELTPLKTKGGERIYREEHINLIEQIYDLTKNKGYTIPGAKEVLKVAKDKLEFQREMTERLRKIRTFLEKLKNNLDD